MLRILCLTGAAFLATSAQAQFWGAQPPAPSDRALMVQPLTDSIVSVNTLPWEFQTALGAMSTTATPVDVAFTTEGFTVAFAPDDIVTLPVPSDLPPITNPGLTAYGTKRDTAYGVTNGPDSRIYAGSVRDNTVTVLLDLQDQEFSSVACRHQFDDQLILTQALGRHTNADLTVVNIEERTLTTIPAAFEEFPGLLDRYDANAGPGMEIKAIDQDSLLLREVDPDDRADDGQGPYYVFNMTTGVAQLVDTPSAP